VIASVGSVGKDYAMSHFSMLTERFALEEMLEM